MKLVNEDERHPSQPGVVLEKPIMDRIEPVATSHYKDWPNAAGFTAAGDQRKKVQLQVAGQFPSYVAGSLYRTGPGTYQCSRSGTDEPFAVHHWFDGFTTVHKFDIVPQENQPPQIWYNSYCQVDEAIEYARKTGKLEGVSFGQKRDPCDTFFQKVKSVFEPPMTNAPERTIIGVALADVLPVEVAKVRQANGSTQERRLLSLTTDAHKTKQLDADTLEPLGVTSQVELHPSLKGPLSAAHPLRDPETGDVYNYNLEMAAKQTYRIFRANVATGNVDILAEISGSDIRGAYLHSFFLTQNFVILGIWPAFFKGKGASILWERNLLDAMAFDTNARSIWLVVDRRHGRGLVKKFSSPPLFCFHTTNAWEEPSTTASTPAHVDITCELVTVEDLSIIKNFYYDNLLSNGPTTAAFISAHSAKIRPTLTRYQLPHIPLPNTSSPSPKPSSKPTPANLALTIPSPLAGDLQNINPAFRMRPHRYVWSTLHRGRSSFIDGLAKTDTRTRAARVWEHPRHTPGEPIFIAAPDAQAEDHGVVLSVVLDGDKGTSYLLCLDASDMTEIARAEVGRPVGFGFHGKFVQGV